MFLAHFEEGFNFRPVVLVVLKIWTSLRYMSPFNAKDFLVALTNSYNKR
jgi:hypothetical protein